MTQTTVAENPRSPLPPGGKAGSVAGLFSRLRKLQAVVGLIGIIIVAIMISPPDRKDGSNVFLHQDNLTNVVRQVSIIGVIALGMTYVILTGGIDLSVGSTLALGATITAIVLSSDTPHLEYGVRIAFAIIAALVVCGAAGLLNGVVTARLALPPFIVTLATMMGLRGLAKRLTNNTNIDFGFEDDARAFFANRFSQKIVVIGCFLGLASVFAVVLKRTIFGRYVRAVGDNEKAAIYAGIPVVRTKVWVYFLCGLLCGVAGVLYAAKANQGNPNAGVGYELEAIAAVVIGGTSLSGGRGTIAGTIVGTLIMGILTNVLQLKKVDPNTELMIKAVIIVLAVWVQSRRRTT